MRLRYKIRRDRSGGFAIEATGQHDTLSRARPPRRLLVQLAQQLREEGAEQALLGAGQLLEGRVDRVVWQGGPDACL
jgi:hypothetical protein